ncbi:putative syntaxin binding protein [Trypanosoma cruzi]|uniref:Putative syntaxin binding protein n=1 Tax=Trypanosoma cruzi TaxID=5693 RepID=A0A2V2WMY2_TRYCR|nr:putative syntaxin binding protein [Trypanosoma cruzi]RNC54427.1 putative syntaxin binding protein [Trypanosoma cruzi]
MSRPVVIVWGGLEAAVIDGEDVYWCSYRHCFLAQCVEEPSVELKKLHAYHPGLAQGVEPKANLAELGSAVRAPPEFWERQARLSLHTDFCARLVAQYREKRLAEVWEVEQDIAVGLKPFRKNLDGVQQLTRDAAMPRPVRLRLLLLHATASSTDELTEVKRQQLIRDGRLTPDAHLLANLEHVTRRAGSVQRYSTASAQSERSTSASASNAATDEDPFLKHACMLVETADRNRTLRVGLSLASMEGDHVMRTNGASGGQNSGEAGNNAGPFQGCGGKGENHPVLGGGGGVGTIALTTPQRIVLLVLGGVACSERRSVHEISKGYSREVFIGKPRCCVLRCVFAGTWHPTAVGLTGEARTGMHRGPKSGKYTNTHDCGCPWGLCALLPAFSSPPRSVLYDTCVCVSTAALLAFCFCFLACAVASHFHATKKADKKGRTFVEHAPTASVFIH